MDAGALHLTTYPVQSVCLILDARKKDEAHLESLAGALEDLFADWPDLKKFDLYTLLEERVTPSMTFQQMESAVELCFHDNAHDWAYRVC